MCHALALAHAQGIVHRDLKPENLFVADARTPNAPFCIKLLDFGIAKLLAETMGGATDTIGSVLWAAPEQVQLGKTVSPATDVWALGLLAFRLLTGAVYWLTPRDPEPTPKKWLAELLTMPIVAASERAAELGVAGHLPPGFDAWFAGCASLDPSRRFPTAAVAFTTLEAIFAAAPAPLASATVPAGPATFVLPRVDSGERPTEVRRVTLTEPARGGLVETTTSPTSRGPDAKPEALPQGRRRTTTVTPLLAAAVAVSALSAIYFGNSDPGPAPGATSSAAPVVAAAPVTTPSGASVPELAPRRADPAPDMARVEGATLVLAATGKRVNVATFDLDRTEVTVVAYRKCMDAGRCGPPKDDGPRCAWALGTGDLPVDCVDKAQAEAYCAFAGGRLPTDEEWERAARGANGRTYPWGDDPPEGRACYGRSEPCRAGSFPRGDTPDGVKDLAGGVLEWTSTRFSETEWVIRGGSYSGKANDITAGARAEQGGTDHYPELGFRGARDVAPEEGR
jgi:hypothetical protein